MNLPQAAKSRRGEAGFSGLSDAILIAIFGILGVLILGSALPHHWSSQA